MDRNVFIAVLAVLVCFTIGYAGEVVTRANGGKVLLKDDHTWVGLDYAAGTAVVNRLSDSKFIYHAEDAVEVWDKSLSLTQVNYRNSVALYIHYLNNTNKKVVAVTVNVAIFNYYGKLLFQKMYEDYVAIQPGERLRNNTCWHFDDNPSVPGEPYDLLWKFVHNGTAKMAISVRKVMFDDGNVLVAKTMNK